MNDSQVSRWLAPYASTWLLLGGGVLWSVVAVGHWVLALYGSEGIDYRAFIAAGTTVFAVWNISALTVRLRAGEPLGSKPIWSERRDGRATRPWRWFFLFLAVWWAISGINTLADASTGWGAVVVASAAIGLSLWCAVVFGMNYERQKSMVDQHQLADEPCPSGME